MSDDNVEVRVNVMPSTDQLRHTGMLLAVRNVRMVLAVGKRLAIQGLTEPQRENVMLAWVGGWAAEWTRLGWPEFTPDEVHAERLTLTSPSPEGEVHPPYAYWMVNVPAASNVRLVNGRNEPEPVTRMLCMHLGGLWSFTALASSCELRQWQMTTKVMCEGSIVRANDARIPELQLHELDEHANAWLCRLLINSAIEAMGATS